MVKSLERDYTMNEGLTISIFKQILRYISHMCDVVVVRDLSSWFCGR